MDNSSRDEWPTDEYMEAWKSFRDLSDENRATAEHLITRKAWPKKNGLVICDIGCGDGRLLEAVLKNVQGSYEIDEVRLIDPDADLLQEAERCIAPAGLADKVITKEGYAVDLFPACAKNADVVLAVHVVYLMRNGQVEKLIRECPTNTPIYVVLDAPDSVFTDIWKETARKYYDRSLRAHDIVTHLPTSEFTVEESRVDATIKRTLFDSDLAPWLLTILCYRDMTKNVDHKMKAKVYKILDRYTDSGNVHCQSVCYEIVRRST